MQLQCDAVEGGLLYPEEVSAYILAELLSSAQAYLGRPGRECSDLGASLLWQRAARSHHRSRAPCRPHKDQAHQARNLQPASCKTSCMHLLCHCIETVLRQPSAWLEDQEATFMAL